MVAVRVECTLNLTRWHTTASFIIITTTTLVLKIHIIIVIHANGSSFIRIWHHKCRGNHDCYNHRNKGFHLLVLCFVSSETISIKQTLPGLILPRFCVCSKLWSTFPVWFIAVLFEIVRLKIKTLWEIDVLAVDLKFDILQRIMPKFTHKHS